MSGISGFQGHLYRTPQLWPGLDAGRLGFLYLHAPRGVPDRPEILARLTAIYRLLAGRLDSSARLAFLEELAAKETGDWGEPERLWPVILEDPDPAVVRRGASLLAARIGADAVRRGAEALRVDDAGRAAAARSGAEAPSAGRASG